MKLKSGIIISELNGEFFAVPSGAVGKGFNGMIRMNGTAAFIVKMFQKGADEAEIVAALCDTYEVDEAIAREDYQAVKSQFESLDFFENE